jgi:hypothetical protein
MGNNSISNLFVFILLSAFVLASCNENGPDISACTSGGNVRLLESECVAEAISSVCNPWGCSGPYETSQNFFECELIDCQSLRCFEQIDSDAFTEINYTDIAAFTNSQFTTIIDNEEFSCILIVP